MLESLADTLSGLGFELTCLGGNAWEVNGVPSVMNDVNPQELLLAIVETADDTGKEVADTLLSRLAGAMANVAAIKSGQPLSTQEMEKLLSELLRLATPNYTHDGKLVLNIITTDDIGKMFM